MLSSGWPRSPSHGKCSKRFCGSSRSYGRSHHQRQHEMFDVMHSRATDRRSASKCQGKWPDQTLDQAFGLPEMLVAGQHLASVLQEGRENANIDAGFGIHLENLRLMSKAIPVRAGEWQPSARQRVALLVPCFNEE